MKNVPTAFEGSCVEEPAGPVESEPFLPDILDLFILPKVEDNVLLN